MFSKFKKNKDLSILLKLLDDYPSRDTNMIREGKSRFLAQSKLIAKSPVTNAPGNRQSSWNQILKKEHKMGLLVKLIVIVGLIFGGSTATAYAAQDSSPEGILYPVKLLTEDLRLEITQTPQSKIGLALKFAMQRVDEINELKAAGLMPPEPVFARLENNINFAIGQTTKLCKEDSEKALLQIRDMLQTRDRIMDQDSEDPVLLRTRSILQERIHRVEAGLADPEGLYNEYRNGWENTPNAGEVTNAPGNGQNGLEITPGGPGEPFGNPTQGQTSAPVGDGGNAAQTGEPAQTHTPEPGTGECSVCGRSTTPGSNGPGK
jgi:hypothetical protein